MPLIIFIKNPELGKVKTRLAKDIGDEKALFVYHKLLKHTRKIVLPIDEKKYLFYDEKIEMKDEWDGDIFSKHKQKGNDLGERMNNAFGKVFKISDSPTLIIGSDCLELTSEIINLALLELKNYDIVIGPTYDGGYYLLGMNKLYPALFENIDWSTEKVFQQTFEKINEESLSNFILPKLTDIDTAADLPLDYLI